MGKLIGKKKKKAAPADDASGPKVRALTAAEVAKFDPRGKKKAGMGAPTSGFGFSRFATLLQDKLGG